MRSRRLGANEACKKAVGNLAVGLDARVGFPGRVLSGKWVDCHLFNSDWIFEGAFVDKVRSMLATEGALCACLANLDRESSDRAAHFMIHDQTTAEEFKGCLQGDGPEDGWIYDLGRFGCVSDRGSWCIYCERDSELAVIGFISDELCHQYDAVLKSLHAGRVAAVVAGRADFELSSHVISAEWKEELARHYR
jgi:hypothetical protein